MLPEIVVPTINLVPDIANPTPDYYCTWQTQLYSCNNGGPLAQRRNMTEQNLFGHGACQGWAYFYPEARRDLLLVMDDSWDVPFEDDGLHYGSHILNREKFPSYTADGATPAEAMRLLNNDIKSQGWRSLGGWIYCGVNQGLLRGRSAEAYIIERLQWANEANWGYWKVDWTFEGAQESAFRTMISTLAHRYAPGLVLENANRLENIGTSDVFRTYDVPAVLSIPMTMQKIGERLAFDTEAGFRGLLNCEDEVYIAAALGCAMGVMRHPLAGSLPNGNPDPSFPALHRNLKTKIDEVARAARWHRIAPAFGVNKKNTFISAVQLQDSWQIENCAAELEEWWLKHLAAEQNVIAAAAPSAISRNMPLPVVSTDGNGRIPFVVAARNPNGSISVATLGRTCARKYVFPKCAVSIEAGNADTFGIFGYYQTLVIHTALNLDQMTILAQDLLSDQAEDITLMVKQHNGTLEIPGELLASIGTRCAQAGDTSEPGLVLKLI